MSEQKLKVKAPRWKKQRKSYYTSPATRGVFHVGFELPIEYREPLKKLAKANDRNVKAHINHIIKNEIEKFLNESAPASATVN